MKKMRKKSILLLAVMMIALLAGSVSAYAATTADVETDVLDVKDSAGNAIVCEKSVVSENFGEDLYWFGNEMSLNDSKIDNDLLAAGYTLTVNNADIKGSLRTASYSLNLQNVDVAHNMTVAGNILNISGNTKAKSIYAAGNEISFSGECESLNIAGNSVILNGVVNGDATIDANEVTIGSNAVVTGKLTVSAADESTVPDAAQIGEYEYHDSPNVPDEDAVEAVSAGARFLHKIFNRVYWVPAMIVVALFFCLVIPGAVDGSGKMLLKKPVAMPITGLVTLCAIPVALIILCITFIGLPLAGLLALLVAIATIFAVPFAGASAGRIVLPKMNIWLSSIIGSAVLTLALAVPFVGGLIKFLSILYVLGYFVQKCYEQIKTIGKKPEQEAAQAVEEVQVNEQ
ncbi:MAG: hypothetical protein Q4G60_08415 [bacterium]|nr:hypothetical protein [bacterium]